MPPTPFHVTHDNTAARPRRRDKLRAAGLRPIQIWVPDTYAPGFAAEAARQCRLVAASTDPDSDELLDRLNDERAGELDRQGL